MDILKSKKIGDGQFRIATEVGTWEIEREKNISTYGFGEYISWRIWMRVGREDCGVPLSLQVHGESSLTKKEAIKKISLEVERRRNNNKEN